MTLRTCAQLGAVFVAFLIVPSPAQSPHGEMQIWAMPQIEVIDFEGLNDVQQKIISKRISLRIGDILYWGHPLQ